MDGSLVEKIVSEVIRKLQELENFELSSKTISPVKLVTEEVVMGAVGRKEKEIRVLSGVVVTPLALDALRREGIQLTELEGQDGKSSLAVEDQKMSIVLGSDSVGFTLKNKLQKILKQDGRDVSDFGVFSSQGEDSLGIAEKVAVGVGGGKYHTGIIVDARCGLSAILANKVNGVRAMVCHDLISARLARKYIDANVLCLGAEIIGDIVVQEIVTTWLSTSFDCSHTGQVRNILELERQQQER